jgi:hypothetical protein
MSEQLGILKVIVVQGKRLLNFTLTEPLGVLNLLSLLSFLIFTMPCLLVFFFLDQRYSSRCILPW